MIIQITIKKKYIDTIKNSNNMSIKEFIEILELKY